MPSLTLQIDADNLHKAFLKAPGTLQRNLERAISRIMAEMARSARGYAPKSFSNLVNSIRAKRINALEGIVAPGINYAQMVEEGTGIYGPTGIATGKLPPVDSIEDWVVLNRIGSGDVDSLDMAWMVARKIAATGTRPQPFLQPAIDDNKARAESRINQAIEDAISGGSR